MKLTKSQLKQIIKEELENAIEEGAGIDEFSHLSMSELKNMLKGLVEDTSKKLSTVGLASSWHKYFVMDYYRLWRSYSLAREKDYAGRGIKMLQLPQYKLFKDWLAYANKDFHEMEKADWQPTPENKEHLENIKHAMQQLKNLLPKLDPQSA